MFSAINSALGRYYLQRFLNENQQSKYNLTEQALIEKYSTTACIEKVFLDLSNQSIFFSNEKIKKIIFYTIPKDHIGLAIIELTNGKQQRLFLLEKDFSSLLINCGAIKESLSGQDGLLTPQQSWDHLNLYDDRNSVLNEIYHSLHQVLAEELKKLLAIIPVDKSIQLIVPGCGLAKEAIACYLRARKTHSNVKVFAFDYSQSNVEDAQLNLAKLFPTEQQNFVVRKGDSYQMAQTLNDLGFQNKNAVNIVVISGGFNTMVLASDINNVSIPLQAIHSFFHQDIHYILGTGRTLLLLNSNHERSGFAVENHYQISKFSDQFYFHRFRKLTIEEQLCSLRFANGYLDLSLKSNPLELLTALSEASRKQIKTIDLSHAYINLEDTDELARTLNKFPNLKLIIVDCFTNKSLAENLQEKNWANRPLIMILNTKFSNLKYAFSAQELKSYLNIDYLEHIEKLDLEHIKELDWIFVDVKMFKLINTLNILLNEYCLAPEIKLIYDNKKIAFSVKDFFTSHQIENIEKELQSFSEKNNKYLISIEKKNRTITLQNKVEEFDYNVFDAMKYEHMNVISQFYDLCHLLSLKENNKINTNFNFWHLKEKAIDDFSPHRSMPKYKIYSDQEQNSILKELERLKLDLIYLYIHDIKPTFLFDRIDTINKLIASKNDLPQNIRKQSQSILTQLTECLADENKQVERQDENCYDNNFSSLPKKFSSGK